MVLDRDLNVAVLRAVRLAQGSPLDAWEMLSATGVRGLRLFHESGAVRSLRLTEAHPVARQVLEANTAPYGEAVQVDEEPDARRGPAAGRFDYVDLDPYGTPAPFVNAALSAIRPGGVLAVTATDMPVLAGVQRGACERRYGAIPLRGRLASEGALRILLGYLSGEAAKKELSVTPLVSYVLDHHVRAYLRVDEGDPGSLEWVRPIDPARFDGPSLPPSERYGPMWLGPLFDPGLVGGLEAPPSAERRAELLRLLDVLQGECRVDRPFYYEANTLAQALGLREPPSRSAIFERLGRAGFTAAKCHVRPDAWRTDAPRAVVETCARDAAVRR